MNTRAILRFCVLGFLLTLCLTASAQTSNLVLYFDFNTNMPGVAVDLSGMGNHGVVSGTTYMADGCGGYLEFDGVDDYIFIPESSSLTITGSLTMAAWFKVYNYDRQRPILEYNIESDLVGVHMWAGVWAAQWGGDGTGANLVDTNINESSYIISTDDPPAGEWHHLAVTYDRVSGMARVYLNGVQKKETDLGFFVPRTDCDLYIGRRPQYNYDLYYGVLDELRIYDAALNSNEISDLFINTTNCEPVVGSVTCTIEPDAARGDGAQWRLTTGPDTSWHNSGVTVVNLPVDDYTISFSDVSGWVTPINEPVSVEAGETASAEGVYTAVSGGTNTLILYYDFNTNGGGTVTDLSGYANDGIVYGPAYVATDCGGMYEFDGSNDYIRVPESPSLTLSNSLSMVVWFKVYDYDAQRPILEWNNPTNPVGAVHMWTGVTAGQWGGKGTGANLVDVTGDENSYIVNTDNPPANQWHHLAVTYNRVSGVARVYIDGVQKGEESLGTFTPNTKTDLNIGMRPDITGHLMYGMLDEIRIYKGELSSNDVHGLYLAYTNCAGTVGSVTCIIEPSGARDAGAQWRLTSGPYTSWQDSGDILENVYVGEYTMEFKDLTAWTSPTDQTIDVLDSATTGTTGTYTSVGSPTNALVLYYDFNSDPAGTATDLSGQGNHGSISGATFTATACGGYLEFDGTNDFIIVPASSSLDVAGSMSLAAWFKVYSYDYQQPILEWNDAAMHLGVHMWSGVYGSQWHGLGSGANLVDVTGNENAYIINAADPVVNVWHHMAVTYDRDIGMARVYIDGILANEDYLGAFTPETSFDFYIGRRPELPYHLFCGQMDEIRVYEGALSAGEVYDLFNTDTNCEPDMASVTCTITPAEARNAGAQWRLTSGETNWNNSGATLANLEEQSYTMTFKDITNWTEPGDQIVALSRGSNTEVSVSYTLDSADSVGPVIVRIRPPEGSVGLTRSAAMVVTVTDNVEVVSVTMNGEDAQTSNGQIWNFDMTGVRGSYNPVQIIATDSAGNQTIYNVNYAQADDMTLTSMWDGYWRVRNPDTNDVSYTWEVVGDTESGTGIAPSNSDSYFTSSPGPKTVKLYVDAQLVDTARSSGTVPAPDGLQDGSLDSDGDGVSNYEEELAGSDVNNATSILVMTSAVDTGGGGDLSRSISSTAAELVFSWQSGPDSMYTVKGSTDLENWFAIPGYVNMPGTGGMMSYTNREDWTSVLYLRLEAAKQP